MIRWLILMRLDAAEKKIGISLDYLREILHAAPTVFFKFMKLKPLAAHHRVLPDNVLHVARIVATRQYDCGDCVQMALNFARQQGMPQDTLQAVINENIDLLEEELFEAYRFAESVASGTHEEAEWRERICQRFGNEGVIELSLATAIAGVFPIMKRGMGYATSCANLVEETRDRFLPNATGVEH